MKNKSIIYIVFICLLALVGVLFAFYGKIYGIYTCDIKNIQRDFNISKLDRDLKNNLDNSDYRVYCLQTNNEYGGASYNDRIGITSPYGVEYKNTYGCKYVCIDESELYDDKFIKQLSKLRLYMEEYNKKIISIKCDKTEK